MSWEGGSIPTTVPTPDLFQIPPEPPNPYAYVEGVTTYPSAMIAVDTYFAAHPVTWPGRSLEAKKRLDQYDEWMEWRNKYGGGR